MSSLPMLVRNVRFGTGLGTPYIFEDHIKTDLVDSQNGLSQIKLADALAKKYGIGREEVDGFALNSFLKWKNAQETKALKDEIASLTVTLKKKEVPVEVDEIPNVNLNLERLSKLQSANKDGVVTNDNSSVPADGAAALILASETAVSTNNLVPLARIVGWSTVGVDLDGIGSVPAVRRLLEEQKMTVNDIDLFEINETNACQALAVIKEIDIDINKVNVNGGALALGHPVSATGARMVTSLVHEIRRRKAKRAIATSSCGGGQGVAVMIESL